MDRTLACDRGGPAVEFAFVAPILVVMGFGAFEVHSLLKASETASRAALQTADLVARETVTTSAELADIRKLTLKSLGLNDAQAGRVVIQISSIGFDPSSGLPTTIRWRSTSGSTLPITLSEAAGLGEKGETVIQVIAIYEHVSPFAMIFPQSHRFRDVAWARPRNTRSITLDGVT